MELYVEKEFLDNFYLDFQENTATKSQRIIANILTEYGEIDWYINVPIESVTDLQELKDSNPFFALRAAYSPPVSIDNIQDHFFNKSLCQQTLILTASERSWFNDATNKGAICLSFENYQEQIEKIIKCCHLRIDLSDEFEGWEILNFFSSIPFNQILINDNYILTDQRNQLMDKNLIPMLRNILKGKQEKVEIKIFTKEFNALSRNDKHVKEAAKKRYTKLNRELANCSKKIRIVKNDLHKDRFDLHDRVLISNFLSIDSGKGFNLIPYKKSNSQIIVETIFDKYTYKRIKNHLRIHKEYLEKFESFETSKFSIYPG